MTGKASVEYDKFEDKTTYRSGEISVLKQSLMSKEHLYLRVVSVQEGESKAVPENVILIARGLTTKITFSELNDLYFIINGETVSYSPESYDSSVKQHSGTYGFLEIITYIMPYSDFVAISNQENVEGKLSIHEFQFDKQRSTVFREFIAQFE